MPISERVVVTIECDNPTCPGNELDPHTRDGWTFVTAQAAGMIAPTQSVYCSPACVAAIAVTLEENARNR
jgi:molybdopterin-guanine dinucleotide biosynthesis protein A